MPTIFVTDEDKSLRRKGKRLIVDKYDNKVADIPLLKVTQVIIFANATLTTPLINSLLENEIPVTFLSYRGKFRGRLMPEFSKNSILRKAQYKASENEKRRLNIARNFVTGKIKNQRRILLRGTRGNRNENSKKIISELKRLKNKSEQAKDLGELRGYEGLSARKYFSIYGKLLKDDFKFENRSKRPPGDEVNALLSFGYMMMYSEVFNLINASGYDPYIGYLHHDKYGKPGLVLDMLEEFRAIVDNLVKRLINRGVIKKNLFQEKYGGYELKEEGVEIYLKKFEKMMISEFKHPVYDRKVDMREAIEIQTRMLAKKLTGEIEEYVAFEVR